jgi:hypothetical protein
VPPPNPDAGRSPGENDMASQLTLSRFQNAISIRSLERLRDVFLDQFMARFESPPCHLTLDLDAVDDPAHGHQQLTFWHGYYDQNHYLPLVLTCADNDQFVMLSLRAGNVHVALGADDDLAYRVAFVDSGTIEPTPELKGYRVTAGFGLRFVVPMVGPVPIALDFGFPIVRGPNHREQVFNFCPAFFH